MHVLGPLWFDMWREVFKQRKRYQAKAETRKLLARSARGKNLLGIYIKLLKLVGMHLLLHQEIIVYLI